MYSENYKTLLKEIKDNTNKWKKICTHRLVNMSIMHKAIYRFDMALSKSQSHFCRNRKYILKFIWNFKGPQTPKIILKKTKVGELTFPDFKTYYKVKIIKTVLCQHKDRHTDQWNRTESRNKASGVWSNDFQQGCQDHSIGKNSLFNRGLRKLDSHT